MRVRGTPAHFQRGTRLNTDSLVFKPGTTPASNWLLLGLTGQKKIRSGRNQGNVFNSRYKIRKLDLATCTVSQKRTSSHESSPFVTRTSSKSEQQTDKITIQRNLSSKYNTE